MSESIRVLMFRDGDMWVAQCLEYDIGAQAADIDTLKARLDVALTAEAEESLQQHGQEFAGINPAPERFHLLWERRTRSVDLTQSVTEHARPLELALVA